MGMMKNYLLKLLEQCSVEQFGQDAIEWAIITGMVHPSYTLNEDVRAVMLRYDEIIEAYRLSLAQSPGKHIAPMERAGHRTRPKTESSNTPARRENAA